MYFERKSQFLSAALLLAGILFTVASCNIDKDYDITTGQIDLSMTVLEDGVTVPIGNTDKISLGNLINKAGENINDFIKTGANGELILTYDGNVSLADQLSELDLSSMAVIDGVSFSEPFSYHMGDFDADKFKIAGNNYDLSIEFEGMDLLNVPTASIAADVDGLSFYAGLDKHKNDLAGDDFNLSAKIGNIEQNFDVIKRGDVAGGVALAATEEIPIPKEYLKDTVLPETKVEVTMNGIKLQEDVTAVTNLKTNPNAKLVVEIQMANVFLTGGTIVPDVDIDFSKVFNIKGNSVVNVKDMELTAANGWSCKKTFDVEGLVKTEYTGSISLSENVVVNGTVRINDPVTTKTRFNATAGDVSLNFNIYFTDLTIDSADIALKPVNFNKSDNISFGNYKNVKVPEEMTNVKAIYLDETKPLTITVTPKNVERLKTKDISCDITLSFPPSMDVKDAVDGKLVLSGDLANGPMTKNIVLKSLKPTVSGGLLSIDANVGVQAELNATNMVINSTQLPSSPAEDLTFAVSVSGTPAIKDYSIELQNFKQPIDLDGKLEFSTEGLADFGSFHIVPEGNPALTIAFDIPEFEGLTLAPSGDGIVIALPDILRFDASAIDPALAFSESANSITIKNSFPALITLPVKQIDIKPTGDSKVISSYSASGAVVISGEDVSQSKLEQSFGSKAGLSIAIPEMKPASVSLDDKLSFDIKKVFDLKISNLPAELKKIDEILLKDVYITLTASFEGLPTSADSQFNVDLMATFPEFIVPNKIPIKGVVKDGKLTIDPVKLEKIAGIEVNETLAITSQISLIGSIFADGATIDLNNLKSDITGEISATIGDKAGKIAIEKASGVFSYDITEQTSLKLDKLPDLLKSDDICLDLADPQINLDIASNLGIPMDATLELVPFRNGAAVAENTITLKDVKLPYTLDPSKKDTKKYCICKSQASVPAGREGLLADISGLLRQIPDSLQVKIIAGVDPTRTSVLETSAKYELELAYGINVPLAFGDKFSFATETELDISGAAQVFSYGDFGVKGKVVNESPLNLSVEMELLDSDSKVIPQNHASKINIAAAATSPIEFYLSTVDKTRTPSKARLVVKVTALPNVPVKNTDSLQLLDLVATAPEGITVSSNK